MQIGDSLVRVNHGHETTLRICCLDVSLDFIFLQLLQGLDFLVYIAKTIVCIDTKLSKGCCMLSEDVLKVDLYTMSKHDGVRNLHHSRLQMQGEQHSLALRLLDAFLIKFTKSVAVHESRIKHLPSLQEQLVLQDGGGAVIGYELNARCAGLLDADGPFV